MATLLNALPTPLPPPGALTPAPVANDMAADLFAAALAVLVPVGPTSEAAPSKPLPEKKPHLDSSDAKAGQIPVPVVPAVLMVPVLPVPTLTLTPVPSPAPPASEQSAPITAPAREAKRLPGLELIMTSGGPALGAGPPDRPPVATALAEPSGSAVLVPPREPVRMGESAPSGERTAGGEAPPSSTSPAVLPQPFAVSTAAVVTPSPAAAPAIATHAMAPQLAKPIFTLAAAAPGEHVMTVKVTPENLGPVTVQAHIGADGVKVELFAPTDAGRAAVQAVLPDLRRDLAEAGLAASLDLSDRGAPQGHGDGADDGERRGRRAARAAVVLGARASPVRASILASGRAAGLDILA